ncbi:MAG TPA: hypothetical protein PK466_14305 [Thermotogota bacterium]|nr:hypothetical protein [Thermotogota bacterium]HPJ88588.1 hypothetical protein [Thermotogota bacterium]HPR97499.1 hypothetical protein [Thermotogota bacterium]
MFNVVEFIGQSKGYEWLTEETLRELMEHGSQRKVCSGMATVYYYSGKEKCCDLTKIGLNVVVSNRTDSVLAVFRSE